MRHHKSWRPAPLQCIQAEVQQHVIVVIPDIIITMLTVSTIIITVNTFKVLHVGSATQVGVGAWRCGVKSAPIR